MGTTAKGIRTPEDSVKISALADAMRTMAADVDKALTPVNPFLGTELPLAADANTYRQTGWYYIRYTQNVAGIKNFPTSGLLHMHVWNTPNGFTYQMVVGYSNDFEVWVRSTGSVTSGSWLAWETLIDRDTRATAAGTARRAMLESRFRARRGGVIGTAGRATVALRFDHGLAKFGSKVLPLLRKYDLPFSQAVNPGTMTHADNNTTFNTLQSWCVNDGGEVWNHGRDHIADEGHGGILNQIATSLTMLQQGLPALAIEGWAPPGTADGTFGGYSPMQTVAQHATFAGRVVLEHHAAVAGYAPGIYRPMPANLETGLGHVTLDAQTPAWADGVLRGAITAGMGVQFMLHPVYLDTAGYLTTANLETILANIAARRDAGEIVVLTPTGQLLADADTSRRDDRMTNGRFTNGLASFTNTAGWEVRAGTLGVNYAATTTGGIMQQQISFSRLEAMLGSSRELVLKVRAPSGAVIRTAITGTGITSTKDHTIPAGTDWREVRTVLTVPANLTGALTVSFGRVSGGPVDLTDVRLQSI